MLKRLVILNSDIYSKADIELDNCNSLQIVGPNNIGKSTLIYALNFLFIIDGREMTFSGNRIGDKSTFNHYFPTINSSFIVFEIFKERFYCILVKRNPDGNLDYYKVDSEYKEDHYFSKIENGQKLKRFDSILSEFVMNGIEHSKFPNRRDVFNFVYQKGKRNNAVVWLNQSVNQDGRGTSNNFSKIYKYLINSKLINNNSLKESLIIADNKQNERVTFSRKNQRDIQTLLKHNREIKVIRSIQREFTNFKELLDQYSGKGVILSELIFAFNSQYSSLYSELESLLTKLKNEKERNLLLLNETLNPSKDSLNQKLGKLNVQLENKEKEVKKTQDLIELISSYEDLQFLEESFKNLEVERKMIESQITQIEYQGLKSTDIESEILDASNEIEKISSQVKSYSNQLIHKISDKQEDKEFLNRILSSDISSLPSESLSKKVEQVETAMRIFDGAIELPKSFTGKRIESIDDLNKQLERRAKEKEVNERLLVIAKNLEAHEAKLNETKREIGILNDKIEKNETTSSNKERTRFIGARVERFT
jgi:ABC-type cobalamin/Fe3+-siderophores transport system ATPase subunit